MIPEHAAGVLDAHGANSGGLTCSIDVGYLCFEHNMVIIQRTKIRSASRLAAGPATIELRTTYAEPRPAGPLDIELPTGQDQRLAERIA